MSKVLLKLACADYARVMALTNGTVAIEGVDLALQIGRNGSWPVRGDLLHRVAGTDEFDGGEGSMGAHLRRVETGDRSFVALPIFLLRGFPMRDLYVRKDGPVRTPMDMVGKRVGLYNWFASGGIWYRHAQQSLGVAPESVEWHVGDVETVGETPAVQQVSQLPPHVHPVADGRFLAEMLAAGEIDAMWSPPRPKAMDVTAGPLMRLFPDFRAAEIAYYRKTGIFPVMHMLVLRREAWDHAPWLGKCLTDAFSSANSSFEASQHGFPDASPWMAAEQETARTVLGADPYHHGLSTANRRAVQTFIDQALEAGITRRPISVDEYFSDYLKDDANG